MVASNPNTKYQVALGMLHATPTVPDAPHNQPDAKGTKPASRKTGPRILPDNSSSRGREVVKYRACHQPQSSGRSHRSTSKPTTK